MYICKNGLSVLVTTIFCHINVQKKQKNKKTNKQKKQKQKKKTKKKTKNKTILPLYFRVQVHRASFSVCTFSGGANSFIAVFTMYDGPFSVHISDCLHVTEQSNTAIRYCSQHYIVRATIYMSLYIWWSKYT